MANGLSGERAATRQVVSWCLFDFANSSYSAVISAVVFPVYFVTEIVGTGGGLGDLWWGRAVSASMAFVALTSPVLGGIADYSGNRKRLLLIYTVVCVAAVSCLGILRKGMVIEGFVLAVVANIGMEGGLVFYNSFLPIIAGREVQGRVSAWGYATGYAGSILSLLLAVLLVRRGMYGATWLMVSLFFAVFAIPAFRYLPPDRPTDVPLLQGASAGWRYFLKTLGEMIRARQLRRFFLSYLVYEDGVNTVIVFSSIFAATTLGFSTGELVGLYLLVQVTALAGAFLLARPIDRWGPKRVVVLSLLLWSFATLSAFFVREKGEFWVIAALAGTGLGTVQAASRSFFAQFIPPGHESEYFGAYALVGKSSAVFGPLVFGSLSSAFGSQRPALLAVAGFFIIGLIGVMTVRGGGPNVRGPGGDGNAGLP